MRGSIRICLFLAVAVLSAGLARSLAAGKEMTVGDFLVRLASLRDPTARDAASATARLRAAGVALPGLDSAKPLTQGDVVTIGNAAGLHLTTSTPSAPFGQPQVDTFLSYFGRQLQGGPGSGTQSPLDAGNGQGQDGNGQGQNGNGQGNHKSRSDPG